MASLTPIQLIFLVVIGQGLFLTFTLFTHKKGNPKANKLLAVAVFLMTYFTFVFVLNESGYRRYLPVIILNGFSITPLIPVIFYFYFRQLLKGDAGKYSWLHFVPFLLQFIYWFPNNTNGLFFNLSQEQISTYYSMTIVRSVSGAHMLIFVAYTYVFFKRFKLDQTTQNQRKWISKIRLFYTILVAAFTLGVLSMWLTDTEIIRYAFFFFLSFFIYLIGYYGYTKSEALFPQASQDKPKYQHSKLTRKQSEEIYQRLLEFMDAEKPYLNPTIKLAHVAHGVNVPPHQLSRVINENYGDNFLDFINKYRIEQAKTILSQDVHKAQKMIAVALDSGFGNKVSFYKNFKKFTGNLPVEYRNKH